MKSDSWTRKICSGSMPSASSGGMPCRDDVERVDRDAEIRAVGAEDDVPRRREILHRAAPRQALERDPDAERHGKQRELPEVADDRVDAGVGVRRCRRLDQEQPGADRAADLQHRLRDVELVGMKLALESLEVAQRFEPRDRKPGFAHGANAGRSASRMAGDVGSRDHHLREARGPRRGELRFERARERRGVDPDVAEIHRSRRRARRGPARTSRCRARPW